MTPLYRCRLLGWLIEPLSVERITVGGLEFLAFHCPCCDTDERTRRNADYNPSAPGVHYLQLTSAPVPLVWQRRAWGGRAT